MKAPKDILEYLNELEDNVARNKAILSDMEDMVWLDGDGIDEEIFYLNVKIKTLKWVLKD